MRNAKTRYMNATITKLGEKLYRIDIHSGRSNKRVRRIVKGSMENARRVIETVRQRENAGRFGWPIELSTRVSVLTQLVVDDYRSNHYKSLRSALTLQKFWNNLAGAVAADRITGDQVVTWANEWIAEGLSPARVNRRMAFLLRGYRLGLKRNPPLVSHIPLWTKRKEAAPRTGYRTWDEFVTVRHFLPIHAKVPVSIEYWFGMRHGEVFSLEWPQVRFNERELYVEIRLEAEDTKTQEQRLAVIGGDLYEVLLAWYKHTERHFPGCTWVCHRDGQKLTTIKTSWQTACVKAGLGVFLNPKGRYIGSRKYRGALIHDFRRTAVTNMEDAGVPRKVAMAISGHKTDSVYRRYHIVKKEHLIEAGRRLVAHHQQQHGAGTGGHSVGISPPQPVTQMSKYINDNQQFGGVAQLVEQRTHKPRVPRSIRGTATNNSRNLSLPCSAAARSGCAGVADSAFGPGSSRLPTQQP